MWTNIRYYYYWFTVKSTISAHIPCLWLIKELGFYGEILLNKTLSNWQILLNKVLKWRFNQEWRRICADTVCNPHPTRNKLWVLVWHFRFILVRKRERECINLIFHCCYKIYPRFYAVVVVLSLHIQVEDS